MILNKTQLAAVTKYNKLLSEGKSKTDAAATVNVPRKTIARWVEADNAPATPIPKATAPAKPPVKTGTASVNKVPSSRKLVVSCTTPDDPDTPTTEEYDRLTKVVSEQMGVAVSDVKYTSSFVDDLGADSLDTVEIVMALEDEFENEITDEEAEKLKTVKDAYEYIMKKLGKPTPAPTPATKADDSNKLVPFQSISLPNAFMIVRDNKPVQIDKNHQNYEKIAKIIANVKNGMIYEKDQALIYDLIDLKASISKFTQGRVTVDDTGVKVDGKPLHSNLANVMMNAMKGGDLEGLTRFAKFHDKMMEAISFKVTKRLFDFVSKTGLRIDDDGDIIALKVVRNTYFDKHSNTMDNSPGNTVQVPRNQVDDDDTQTCSYGLHVCAPGYIKHFSSSSGGDKLVEVKVDPRDFVAIPPDYNFDKARCCKYIVLRDVSSAYKKELYNTK